jgi:hypothetical protein
VPNFILLISLFVYISSVSADNGDTGFNPLYVMLPFVLFIVLMVPFSYSAYFGPKQKVNKQRGELANAIIMKNSIFEEKRESSKELFEKLAKSDETNLEVKVISILNYNDYLELEYKSTGSLENLEQMVELYNDLANTGRKMFSTIITFQAIILKAKTLLLLDNIEEANRELMKAELIAEEKSNDEFIMRIKDLRSSLFNEEAKQIMTDLDNNLEKFDKIGFGEEISYLLDNYSHSIPSIRREVPVWLLILNEGGISIFTMKFIYGDILDDQLFAGFITAINSFSKEVFSQPKDVRIQKSTIDYIKYGEFTLILKPFQSFLFTYVIKGQSDNAEMLLEELTVKLRNDDDVWKSLNKNDGSELYSNERKAVENYVDQIFFTPK